MAYNGSLLGRGTPGTQKGDHYNVRKTQRLYVLILYKWKLIDEKFADEMLQVKNFIPAISIEGYARRPIPAVEKDVYAAVVRA
jgi:hypothetical protein